MLNRILPPEIIAVIEERLNVTRLYELRFRSGMPLAVCYGGSYYYLGKSGLSEERGNAFTISPKAVEDIVLRASEYSLYAVNSRLMQGFITVRGGIRIGICGELVRDGEQVKTIKNYTSVNIRIPHEVKGCAGNLMPCFSNGPVNMLIAAPPGAGKTTYLRDIVRGLSRLRPIRNILLVDERCEIAAVFAAEHQSDIGHSTDVIANCPKSYAFEYGIRSMRPDLIVTDELMGEEDIRAVHGAALSGVSVIASIHAAGIGELCRKRWLKPLIDDAVFDRYAVLSSKNGPGTLEGVFDAALKPVEFSEPS